MAIAFLQWAASHAHVDYPVRVWIAEDWEKVDETATSNPLFFFLYLEKVGREGERASPTSRGVIPVSSQSPPCGACSEDIA